VGLDNKGFIEALLPLRGGGLPPHCRVCVRGRYLSPRFHVEHKVLAVVGVGLSISCLTPSSISHGSQSKP
jgi:hypothetical protein